jgi:hypothetical protein
MPGLISGSTLRSGGSNTFITLKGAQPQLPPSPTTSTGYTIVTDNLLQTTYRTSLGNMEMNYGTIFSNIPNQNITLAGTGTGVIVVTGGALSTSTNTGALQVVGGIGTTGDIFVNGITIGQGYQGLNNITMRGAAKQPLGDANDGQENIVIGYDNLLGLYSAEKNIAIGRYTLQSGTNLIENIAIGDSALQVLGNYQTWPVGSITAMTKSTSTVITVNNHGLISGDEIRITGIITGPVDLNDQNLWVKVIDPNTLALYSDNILNQPVDTTIFPTWVSGGVVGRVLVFSQNTALGVGAGSKLYDGEQNLFLGCNAASVLTTGSYNVLIGHQIAGGIITGSGNIAIGGDNLIDGLNNQVNIGSVLYYDGTGNLYLNGDTVVGLGTIATSTLTGALNVIGGIGVTNNIITGDDVTVNGLTIGQGYRGTDGVSGINNIVIQGIAQPIAYDEPNGQETIVIGYSSLQGDGVHGGLLTSYKNIAIGRYTLSTGTNIENTIAIGDSALKNIGTQHSVFIGNITNGTATDPVTLTVPGHGLSTGTEITILGISGMDYLNNEFYFVKVISPSVVALYIDINVTVPLNGIGYGNYAGGGTLNAVIPWNGNLALGNNAGINLNNGQFNTFIGLDAAENFTAGSNNLFVNHTTPIAMTNGSGNIAIGGDNLIDGLNNQINIGSVIYYDGQSTLKLLSNTQITNDLQIDGTTYSVVEMIGGARGSLVYQASSTSTTFLPIGGPGEILTSNGTTPYWSTVSDLNANTATVADSILVNPVATNTNYYLALSDFIGGTAHIEADTALTYNTTNDRITVNQIAVQSTASSTSTTTGALTVAGGVGVGGSVYSADGSVYENNLLYSPRVTVSTGGIAPPNPRVGDYWFDPSIGAEMQYIQDGTSRFWLQISTIA